MRNSAALSSLADLYLGDTRDVYACAGDGVTSESHASEVWHQRAEIASRQYRFAQPKGDAGLALRRTRLAVTIVGRSLHQSPRLGRAGCVALGLRARRARHSPQYQQAV
jgi:hypothetical protein